MSIFHSFGDLTQLLSRDQSRHVIGEVHAQFITAGVLIGVDFLHQNSIVHGNIKPSKVLINALGYPVLVSTVYLIFLPDGVFLQIDIYHDNKADELKLLMRIYIVLQYGVVFFTYLGNRYQWFVVE